MRHVRIVMECNIHSKFDTKDKFIQYLIKFFGKDGMLKNVTIKELDEI